MNALLLTTLIRAAGRSTFVAGRPAACSRAEAARSFALRGIGGNARRCRSCWRISSCNCRPMPGRGIAGRAAVQRRVSLVHVWRRSRPDRRPITPLCNSIFCSGSMASASRSILLTTVLTVSCVLISWESIRERAAGFYACLLLLEAGLDRRVLARSILMLFYVFFEFTLVPLFFLIGIWGGPQRRYAAIKFFLVHVRGQPGDAGGPGGAGARWRRRPAWRRRRRFRNLPRWLAEHPLPDELQIALFLAISVGFMVKVPVFPLHTWLPLAHVEAPTAGSVLLAGVLLKLGTYGILRLCLPMFPYACQTVGIPLMADARGGRHHLRLAVRACAARYQEARRLQQRGASWLLHAGAVRAERGRHFRRRAADDQSRPVDRRRCSCSSA